MILTLLLALLAKFVIFENKEELEEDLQTQATEDLIPNSVDNNLSNGASYTLLEKYLHTNSTSHMLSNSLPSLQMNETIYSHLNTINTHSDRPEFIDARGTTSLQHVPTFTFSLDEDSDDGKNLF